MDSFDMVLPTDINEGNLTSNVPMYSAPEWEVDIVYDRDEYMFYDGDFYQANRRNSKSSSPPNFANWDLVTNEVLVKPWKPGETYDAGDLVAINYANGEWALNKLDAARIYISTTDNNTGNDPELGGPEWLFNSDVYMRANSNTLLTGGTVKGAKVVWDKSVYECLISNTPLANGGWMVFGPTNRWAMFDDQTGTQTTQYGEFWFTVDASGWVDQLSLLNINASNIHVTVKDDNDVIVFDEDIPLVSTENVKSIYEYFFSPIRTLSDVYIDIPATFKPTVTVTVTSQPAAIGHVVMGQLKRFGLTLSGAEIGIDDFSRKVRDDFGGYTIVERPFVRRGQFDVLLANEEVDYIYETLSNIRATPALFIASQRFTSLYYFGLARSWGIRFDTKCNSILRIEVEGLS